MCGGGGRRQAATGGGRGAKTEEDERMEVDEALMHAPESPVLSTLGFHP